jgi:hypothetical protein
MKNMLEILFLFQKNSIVLKIQSNAQEVIVLNKDFYVMDKLNVLEEKMNKIVVGGLDL